VVRSRELLEPLPVSGGLLELLPVDALGELPRIGSARWRAMAPK